jgi:hypothetical protein
MEKAVSIKINKNRGWRGLAEVRLIDKDYNTVASSIFSFSQGMWDDLVDSNRIVMEDDDNYYVIRFDDEEGLPKPTQQRSVLIKNFTSAIIEVNKYAKDRWTEARPSDWRAIKHFKANTNNHTTSNYNFIGVRVIPEI